MAKNAFKFLKIMVLMTFVVQNIDVGEAYTMKIEYKSPVFNFLHRPRTKWQKTPRVHVFCNQSVGRSVQNFGTPRK